MTAVAFAVRPRRVVIAATAEIVTGVALTVLAILAASDGAWDEIPIWLGAIGALGLLSGIGLLYQIGLARATSLVFGLITGAGALIALVGENSRSPLWTVVPLAVFASSVIVIYGSGSLTIRRFGALLVAVVMLVWVIPAVAGPEITCIGYAPVACEDVWQDAVARARDDVRIVDRIFPLTVVRMEECGLNILQWGPFGVLAYSYMSSC